MLRRISVAAAVLSCALAAVAVVGCAATVSLKPAPGSNDAACAEVSVRLPDDIDGQPRRWTDAQATGAWGDPAAVLVTCGVAPPGPTEEKCITIGGIDWIVDESEAPKFLVTTYGRTPAVQVFYDNELVSGNDVLDRLATSVAQLPVDGECTSTETLLPAP